MKFRITLLATVISLALLTVACTPARQNTTTTNSSDLTGTLTVFHAGSLSIPLQQAADAFTAKHPGVRVERVAAGSRSVIRQVTELGKQTDVLASADYRLIPDMMYPNFAHWTARFATNKMVIAYTDQSKFATEINSNNWYNVLLRPGVRYGHSDPNADPCGYRTIMLWQLAETYNKSPGLAARLQQNCPQENIRPKAVELLALLESNELDYAFEYLSVAVQHQLHYVELPKQIDLSSPQYANLYSQAVVELSGKTPGSTVQLHGAPIVYGLTIPTNAPHPRLAAAFVAFLLGPEGQRILQQNGQPPIAPAVADHPEKMPDTLRPLVTPTP